MAATVSVSPPMATAARSAASRWAGPLRWFVETMARQADCRAATTKPLVRRSVSIGIVSACGDGVVPISRALGLDEREAVVDSVEASLADGPVDGDAPQLAGLAGQRVGVRERRDSRGRRQKPLVVPEGGQRHGPRAHQAAVAGRFAVALLIVRRRSLHGCGHGSAGRSGGEDGPRLISDVRWVRGVPLGETGGHRSPPRRLVRGELRWQRLGRWPSPCRCRRSTIPQSGQSVRRATSALRRAGRASGTRSPLRGHHRPRPPPRHRPPCPTGLASSAFGCPAISWPPRTRPSGLWCRCRPAPRRAAPTFPSAPRASSPRTPPSSRHPPRPEWPGSRRRSHHPSTRSPGRSVASPAGHSSHREGRGRPRRRRNASGGALRGTRRPRCGRHGGCTPRRTACGRDLRSTSCNWRSTHARSAGVGHGVPAMFSTSIKTRWRFLRSFSIPDPHLSFVPGILALPFLALQLPLL